MEDTITQELASHGTASWLLTSGLLSFGLVALLVALQQTNNPWIYVAIIAISFREIINRHRLSDPDESVPSWWPWGKKSE
mgnify:CR=1 FL=1|jgi:hypothetical protein